MDFVHFISLRSQLGGKVTLGDLPSVMMKLKALGEIFTEVEIASILGESTLDATDEVDFEAFLRFFTTKPYACEPSSLPKYPPCKEMDVKLRDEEARRQRGTSFKGNLGDGTKRVRSRDRGDRAVPAPEANAELQVNLDRWRQLTEANAKSKSEKFPNPNQGAKVPFPRDTSQNGLVSFVAPDTSFTSSIFEPHSSTVSHSNSLRNMTVVEGSRRKANKEEPGMAPSRAFIRAFKPSSFGRAMELTMKGKQSISEVFGGS